MQHKAPVGVYDLQRLVGFLYSAESLIVMAKRMDGGWSTSDMGPLVNSMYALAGLFGTVPPGTFQVMGGEGNMLQVWTNVSNGLETFLEKSARSPHDGATYVHGLMGQRAAAVAKINGLIANSLTINAEVGRQAQSAARACADIQFAMAVVGAGLSCFISMGATGPVLVRTGAQLALRSQQITAGTRGAAAVIGAAGNIGGGVLKDMAYQNEVAPPLPVSLQAAQDIWSVNQYKAIIVENSKKGGEAFVGAITAKSAFGKAHHHLSEMDAAVAAGQVKVDRLHRALGEEMKRRARKNAQRNAGKAAMAQRGLQQAAATAKDAVRAASKPAASLNYAGSVAHRGLPLIYFAYDVWDAYGDLQTAYSDSG